MPAQTVELSVAQSAVQASAAASSLTLGTASMGVVAINVTSAVGTTPKITFWCEWSPDNDEWFHLIHDFASTGAETVATDITATTGKRNIVTELAAAGKVTATYKHIPSGNIRLRWLISGSYTAGQGFAWDAVKLHVK